MFATVQSVYYSWIHCRVSASLAALTCHTITYSRIVFVVAAHGWIDATYARRRVLCASLCCCCCCFVFSLASIMLLFIQQFRCRCCCYCCCWPKQLVRQAGRGRDERTRSETSDASLNVTWQKWRPIWRKWLRGSRSRVEGASRLSGAPCRDAKMTARRRSPSSTARTQLFYFNSHAIPLLLLLLSA